MELPPNLHAFLWASSAANNCNTYLIHSKEKNILIDPGHAPYFDHVGQALRPLGLSIEDIDLVIGTHAHPDHKESIRRMASLDADWLLSGHGDVIKGNEAVRDNFSGVERTWFRYI